MAGMMWLAGGVGVQAQTGLPVFSASPARAVEGNNGTVSVRVPVYLSAASASEVTVGWATADGTAVAGVDYGAGTGTVVFAPGETVQSVVVEVTGDTVDENDELFEVRFQDPAGAELGDAAVRVLIREDEVLTTVSAPFSPFLLEKSAEPALPVVMVANPLPGRTAGYALTGGTGTVGTDVALSAQTVELSAAEVPLPLTVLDDASEESDETFELSMVNPGPRVTAVPSRVEQVLPATRPPVSMAVEGDVLVTGDGVDLKIRRRGAGGFAEEAVIAGAAEGGVFSVTLEAGVIAADFRNTGIKLFTRQAGVWTVEAVVPLPVPAAGVGRSMALQDGTLVIGMPAATGGQGGTVSGAVRIYERHLGGRGVWGERQILTPVAGQPDFGTGISLWGDLLVAGAPGSYAVSLFQRTGGDREWSRVKEYVRLTPGFGVAFAVTGDAVVFFHQGRLFKSQPIPGEPGAWSDPPTTGSAVGGPDPQLRYEGGLVYGKYGESEIRFWVGDATGAWGFAGTAIDKMPSLPVARGVTFDGSTLVVTGSGNAEAAELLVLRGNTSTLTMVDDESLRVTIDDAVVWPGSPGTTLRLSRPLPVWFQVLVRPLDGTAVFGSDYDYSVQQTITFEPGTTVQPMRVMVYPPEAGEMGEQFSLKAEPWFGRTGPDATVTITDGPPPMPLLFMETSSLGVVEGHAGTKSVRIGYVLSAPALEGSSFTWKAVSETAMEGSDFPPATATVQVPAGASAGSFQVLINGDTEGEWEERFQVVLSDAVNMRPESSVVRTLVTISNDDTGVARNDTFTIPQGTVFNGPDLRINDTRVTQVVLVNNVISGSLTLYTSAALAGTFVYTPTPNFIGQEQFIYTDAFGTPDRVSAEAVVRLNVTDGLRPPVVMDDSFSLNEDTVLNHSVPAGVPLLLANDRLHTAEGTAYDPILEVAFSEVTGGVLTDTAPGDGRFKFTPLPDFSGLAGFRYRVRDKDGWSDAARVRITVRDDLPLAAMERLAPVGSQLHRAATAVMNFPTGVAVDAFLELKAGQTLSLRAEMSNAQPMLLGRLELRNAADEVLTGGVAGDGSLEHIPIPADGRYRILAGETSANRSGTFTVLVNGGLPRLPTNQVAAYSLDRTRPAGSSRAAAVLKMTSSTPFYFWFEATAGEPFELFLQSSGVQTFSLRRAGGPVLAGSSVSPVDARAALLRYTPAATETLYAVVNGSPGGATESTLQLHRPGNSHEYAAAAPPLLTARNTGFLRGPGVVLPGSPQASVTFAAFGDYGSGSVNEAAVASMVKSWNPDFLIAAGDHNYSLDYLIGSATWKTTVGNFYGEFIKGRADNRFPEQTSLVQRYFPVPGNHDSGPDPANGGELSSYLDYFYSNPGGNPRLPQGVHQPRLSYYKMSWGNADFFFLDSDNASVNSAALAEQRQWLKTQIGQSTARWKFGVWHHPPFSSSLHGNHTFIQWGADFQGLTAIITGHDHIYERLNIGNGVTQFIVGNGGSSFYSINSLPAAGSVFRYNSNHGALKILTGPDGVQFDFCAAGPGGGTVVDSLTVGTPPAPVVPSGTDTWALRVQPGQSLQVSTRTPPAPGGLVNGLNPRLEVLDASGAVVAASSAGAPDGLNAAVHFTVPALPDAPPEGVLWTVKVINESPGQGEYEILTALSSVPLYDAWARENLPALPALPDEDPDHDGAPNLMEFLMDSDPRIPSPGTPVTPLSAAGTVQLRLNLPADWTRPVGVILQSSANLTDSPWTALATKSAGGTWTAVAPGISLPVADPAGGFLFTPVPQGRQFYRLAFELE